MPETTASRWTDEFLDSLRTQKDPVADEAAASIYTFIGNDKEKFKDYLKELVRLDFSDPFDEARGGMGLLIPPALSRYMADHALFQFNDEEREILESASRFFEKYGPACILLLGVRSLLKQYAHTKAIQVLRMTQLLEKHQHRRIIETMQFVIDVMQPGWHVIDENGNHTIDPKHPGIQSIQKLRLMHAMVRFRIKHKMHNPAEGDWDDDWGKPINQEDMMFATQTFNIEVIQGLVQVGYKLTPEEIQTYYQAWQLIGRALGVAWPKEQWPKDFDEGEELQNKIYARHFTLPNEYGPVLSEALIVWLDEVIPVANRKTVLGIIRKFNGKENWDILEDNLKIKIHEGPHDLHHHLKNETDLEPVEAGNFEVPDGRENFYEALFTNLLNGLLGAERGGKPRSFRISDGFYQSWELDKRAEKPPSTELAIGAAIVAFFKTLWQWIVGLFSRKK